MNTVQGKNINCYVKVGISYFPLFCGKSMTYSQSMELIETTNTTNGAWRDYEAGFLGATMSVSGVTISDNLDNRISINYLNQQSVRRVKQDFKITMVDDNGDTFLYTFQGLIPDSSFNKTIPGFSQSDITIQVCGEVTITEIPPPDDGNEVIYSDWWTFPAGDTSIGGTSDIHAYNLIDVTVLEVNREGLQHDIITSGTPGNRQCKHDNTAGEIGFDTDVPSNGETVFVVFKRIL